MNIEDLQATTAGLFPSLLGLRFLEAGPDLVRAELPVRDELCTLPGVLHGGAVKAFADTLGACGTALSMPQGARTTTIESKTNFFRAGRSGQSVVGTSTPLHKGRTTMVWSTRIEDAGGALVALVHQTQIVIAPEESLEDRLGRAFAGLETEEQKKLLARLERAGASLYRGWAAEEPENERRAALLDAAAREDDNASLLDGQTGAG